jgi:hypothetical protein
MIFSILHYTIGQHSIGNFGEAGNICAGNVVTFLTISLGRIIAVL